jgi:multiple sugar transport system substrate-binding protein
MNKRSTCAALAAVLPGTAAFASGAFADNVTMWAPTGGANAAARLADLWNWTHPDKIELTTIPDIQMATKLAIGVQANEVPDRVWFDLI